MTDENDIIDRLLSRTHKEAAFAELLDLYQERLYWHIRKLVYTHEDTNDVLQNSFLRIYKGLPKFKRNSSLFTWIYKIAYNESMRFLDKNKKRYTHSFDDLGGKHLETLVADPYFEGNEIQLKLQRLLLALPERQRQIFQMKYYDDLKFREIEEIMGIKQGTLKTSYYGTVEYIKKNMPVLELLEKTEV